MLQKEQKNPSIVFSWKEDDFEKLLKSCLFDDEVNISLQYLNDKNASILEAGCGLGRVVKYLHARGYRNIQGIELDRDSVAFLNKKFPELKVIHGNILEMPYGKKTFDVVLSYGVIEHFSDGPIKPMLKMYDVLKNDGLAIVTVPSFNILRRIKYKLSFLNPKCNNFVRKLFNKKVLHRNGKKKSYYIEPQFGNFFEYRFTPKQFKLICKKSGFKIIKSLPIAHVDGLFHSPFRRFVKFGNWEFKLSFWGKILNEIFKCIPYLHNHMQLCVLKKNRR